MLCEADSCFHPFKRHVFVSTSNGEAAGLIPRQLAAGYLTLCVGLLWRDSFQHSEIAYWRI